MSASDLERFLQQQAYIQKEVARALSGRLQQARLEALLGDDRKLKKALEDMGCTPAKCSEIAQQCGQYDFTQEAMAKFLMALEDLCPVTNRWTRCPITGRSDGANSSSDAATF